ncbi:hypothetical protein Ancab_006159 [Ancistrocladus abbreviatus]
MDWCVGSEIDDFVVPRHEELLDQLPSPNSWSQWGTNESGSSGWPNNFGATKIAHLPDEENCLRMLFGKVGCQNSKNDASSMYGVGSEDSLKRIPVTHDLPDLQFNNSMGMDQMDDIFLNSLLKEHLLGTECNDNLLYLSPESHYGVMPADSNSTTLVLDMQSIPSDTETKYFGNHGFSQSASWDRGEITMPNLSKCDYFDQSDGKQEKASEAKLVLLCDQNSSSSYRSLGKVTSLEESVLQELEAALTQLTEKTRLCFRDSLYRLALNSNEKASTQTQSEGAHEKTRSRRTETAESETNGIDRAVANLMFKKVDANTCDLLPAMSAKFKEKLMSSNYSWNHEEIVLFSQPSTLSTDRHVPALARQDPTSTRFN